MTWYTVAGARAALLTRGCDPQVVEDVLWDNVEGLDDDRWCYWSDPLREHVPMTTWEFEGLRAEVEDRTLDVLDRPRVERLVAMDFTTSALREAMGWSALPVKRAQLRRYRYGRMVSRPTDH
jgi:hypothetical protein